jgi:excisionase family DNA binding protein
LPESTDRRALSRNEAADLYGVHETVISRAIHAGELAAKKVGRQYRIETDALKAWFDALPDA